MLMKEINVLWHNGGIVASQLISWMAKVVETTKSVIIDSLMDVTSLYDKCKKFSVCFSCTPFHSMVSPKFL